MVSVSLFATQTGSADLLFPAAGVYLLGGPVVHAAHGRWETATASFGLRLGLPLGAALVGAGLGSAAGNSSCSHDFMFPNYLVGAVIGGIIGLIAAPVVDAAVLGYEPDPTATKGTVVVPTVSWVPGGASAGLAGQF